MACYSTLKGYKDVETGGLTFRRKGTLEKMEVACGQCLGCRLDYGLMWSIRLVHESTLHATEGGNCFITLTYRDRRACTLDQLRRGQHVPDDWSLYLSHFQKFMKRLRRRFSQKIRYFHTGEYGRKCRHGVDLGEKECFQGCMLGRPHYHACLFNVEFDDLVAYVSDYGEPRFTSPTLEELWGYGFVDVGSLDFCTAAYCARYILKKINGIKAWDHYLSSDLDGNEVRLRQEYSTMSRRPGIGRAWFEKYWSDVFPSDECPVPGRGIVRKVPRFYEEIFKETRPMALEEIKAIRQRYKREHPEEFEPERLEDKYKCRKANLALRRGRTL